MTTQDYALFGHLLSVVLFFSGMAIAAAAAHGARSLQRAGEVAAVLRLARVGVVLVGVGVLGIVAFGFWLLGEGPFDIGDGWVSTALGLLVVSAVLGAFGGQRPKRARELAAEAPPDAPVPAEVARLLADPLARAANGLAALAAVAVLLVMIWKPGA